MSLDNSFLKSVFFVLGLLFFGLLAGKVEAQSPLLLDNSVVSQNQQSAMILHPKFDDGSTNIAFYAECPTSACPDNGTVEQPEYVFFAENTGHGELPFSDYWAPDSSLKKIVAVEYFNDNQQFSCSGLSLADCLANYHLVSKFNFEIVDDDQIIPQQVEPVVDQGSQNILVDKATLHLINLVVNNDAGGAAVASDFLLRVRAIGTETAGLIEPGVAAPGAALALEPGTYVVSEEVNDNYLTSFSGDCDAGGKVILNGLDDKICTIINVNVPAKAPGEVVQVGSVPPSVEAPAVPLIGIINLPANLAISDGSGEVNYNYTVWNVGGQTALVDVGVTDDKCESVVFVDGDLNNNLKLDVDERWKYSCKKILTATTTNTAVATGYSDDVNHLAAIDTSMATVLVGGSVPSLPETGFPVVTSPYSKFLPPLITMVKIPSRSASFFLAGAEVNYIYTLTNPGVVAVRDVAIIDDGCSSLVRVSGDLNDDNLLDPSETWKYVCQNKGLVSASGVAMVRGRANGFLALDYAFTAVLTHTSWQFSELIKVGMIVVVIAVLLTLVVLQRRIKY